MSEERVKQFALLLKAIDDLEMDKAEFMADWKDRKTKLMHELKRLKSDVLSGQMELKAQ